MSDVSDEDATSILARMLGTMVNMRSVRVSMFSVGVMVRLSCPVV